MGYVGSEQLVGCAAAASGQPWLSASAPPARLTTLTLLLKVSAMVTDYRKHGRTLFFLPGIISLFIMVEGRRARTEL